MNSNNTTLYVQVRTPDKVALAEIVMRAKGSERTMAQFAEDCELSASTLSRIVNGKITKPLAIETLTKIYEKRADSSSEALLEFLVRANGMMSKEDFDKYNAEGNIFLQRNANIDNVVSMKNVIMNELFDRGIPVVRASRYKYRMDEGSNSATLFPGQLGNMTLTLSETTRNIWAFYWFPQIYKEDDNRSNLKFCIKRVIDDLARLFLLDSWKPDTLQDVKVSFVFVDATIYDGVLKALQNAKLHNEMSLILVDLNSSAIMRELWLPGDYVKPEQSIFDTPKLDMQEDNDIYISFNTSEGDDLLG